MPNFLKTPGSGVKNVLGTQRGGGLSSGPNLNRKMQPKLPRISLSAPKGLMSKKGAMDQSDPSQVVKSPAYTQTQLYKNGGNVPGPSSSGSKNRLNKSTGKTKVISTKNF